MADYVLSILPSKLCAATALCSKLIFSFYNNEEHKRHFKEYAAPGSLFI